MVSKSEQILRAALELKPVERAELVEQILGSFDFPARREIDDAWAAEAEDRIDAHDRGELPATPAEQVFDQINDGQSK